MFIHSYRTWQLDVSVMKLTTKERSCQILYDNSVSVLVKYNEAWKQTGTFGVDRVNCRNQWLQQQNVLGDRGTRDQNDAICSSIVGHVTG
jgi:hypothetical protein